VLHVLPTGLSYEIRKFIHHSVKNPCYTKKMTDKHQPWKALLPDICFWGGGLLFFYFIFSLLSGLIFGIKYLTLISQFFSKIPNIGLFSNSILFVSLLLAFFSFCISKLWIKKIMALLFSLIYLIFILLSNSGGDFG